MAKASQELAATGVLTHEHTFKEPLKHIYSRRISHSLATLTLIIADACILYIALSLAFIIRLNLLPSVSPLFASMPSQMLLDKLWIVMFTCILCIAYEGLYSKRLRFWQETRYLIRAVSLGFILVLAVISLGKLSDTISRFALMMGYCFTLILLPLGRQSIRAIVSRVGIGIEHVIILGSGRTGIAVGNALLEQKYLGYKIVGFLDEDPSKQHQPVLLNGKAFLVLGSFRDTDRVMAQTGAGHLIVAAPSIPSKTMVGLINRLQREAVSVTVIPNLHGVPVMGVEADNAFGDKVLSLHFRNNLARPLNRFVKRTFDVIASIAILLVILPILALIVIAIKLDSPGPIAFSHRRVRMHGDLFGCYKFRTMFVNAQEILDELLAKDPALKKEWKRDFKLKNDPRTTRVGKFLRKTSLDELPQIFNVLKGEMSLVGPRPIVEKEIERFGYSIAYYFMVRPGITGLWQVSGRNNISYDERVDLEAWYVRNWSLWLDITLLIRTVSAVLDKTGAY
ncbi:MAG TPA: undecaprenyl-phosphate galactose phosphotransferase WbaP [Candidatus Aquicultor sp.]|jgi:undecaprenyl-phosphate galactose phosphotransferase